MKKTQLIVLLLSLLTAVASMASQGRGGGDMCEDQIKIARDEIVQWIAKNGPQKLNLPAPLSVRDYSLRMLEQTGKAKIVCVSKGDPGYPVMVDGIPKECRFDTFGDKSLITCDAQKFQALPASRQYILIHHEFAGLAGIETPNGSDSNYQISNQLSAFVTTELVTRLAISPQIAKVRSEVLYGNSVTDYEQQLKLYGKILAWSGRSIVDVKLGETDANLGKKVMITHTAGRRMNCSMHSFDVDVLTHNLWGAAERRFASQVDERLKLLNLRADQLVDSEIIGYNELFGIQVIRFSYCR